MAVIKALDADSIHKLCSSEVVVTLGIAVKELVENSIDACAKKIEIKLKNYGCDSIEVIDDGIGIDETNLATLCKKHSTSKIRDFKDLENVGSFGFRGEALNSLCQLADVTIQTRAISSITGTKIEFSNNGTIKSQRPLARSKGTTVLLERLFHTLPVRRFHLTDTSRLMKEFSKTVSLVTSYCLALVDVQLSCHRFGKHGEKIPVVSNVGAKSVAENIAAVYGQSQLDSLVEIPKDFVISDELKEEYSIKLSSKDLQEIRISGFITSPPGVAMSGKATGGRSSADRQFVCVNGRPCEFVQLTRLATDVWRRCCRESLAATAALQMPSRSTTSTFPVLILFVTLPRGKVDINLCPDKRQLMLQWERPVVMKVKAALLAALSGGENGNRGTSLRCIEPLTPRSISTLSSFIIDKSSANESMLGMTETLSQELEDRATTETAPNLTQKSLISPHLNFSFASSPTPPVAKRSRITIDHSQSASVSLHSPQLMPSTPIVRKPVFDSPARKEAYDRNLPILSRRTIHTDFSMERVQAYWTRKKQKAEDDKTDIALDPLSVGCFRAGLTETDAQTELTTIFRREWFQEMKVVGQFNRGFIVGQRANDLFIVDQHASDEKHRFEKLCANHQFASQPLVVRQQLNLTAVQENVLEEFLDVFSKNGFAFSVDDEAPLGQKFCLIAAPMSEGKIFGRSDVEEMIFVLSASLSRNCRPSKLRDVLASRSCRSAVMIGTALNQTQMLRILSNMSTMEHPWNCPHGRPTMRHLLHLGRLNHMN